jgi:uncharacterized membrane protein
LKSRFIAQIEPYLTSKNINRLLATGQNDGLGERQSLFRMLESVAGLHLAVFICVLNSLNAISLHCMVIKWFYEDISPSLFQAPPVVVDESSSPFISAQNSSASTTNNFTLDLSLKTASQLEISLLELLTNLVYYLILLLSAYDFLVKIFNRIRANKQAIISIITKATTTTTTTSQTTAVNNLRMNDESPLTSSTTIIQILLFDVLFYILLAVILGLTLSKAFFKIRIECENFFKHSSFQFVSIRTQRGL